MFSNLVSACSLLNDAFQWLILYSVEWRLDKWMMGWKECSKWAGICRTFSLNFIPALINIYYIRLTFSLFLAIYSCFAFRKYTSTSKFPIRALVGKDVASIGRGLIWNLLSQHLPEGTEEKHEKTFVMIASFRAEIWTEDFRNTK
jgi:hypothetical protein